MDIPEIDGDARTSIHKVRSKIIFQNICEDAWKNYTYPDGNASGVSR